jgi:hypothetical protein
MMGVDLEQLSFTGFLVAHLLAVIVMHQSSHLEGNDTSRDCRVGSSKRPDVLLPPARKDSIPVGLSGAVSYCLGAVVIGAVISIIMGPPPVTNAGAVHSRSLVRGDGYARLQQVDHGVPPEVRHTITCSAGDFVAGTGTRCEAVH